MISAYHTGDAGDVLASLPILRALGGGEIVVGPHTGRGGPREPMTAARARFLMPLVAEQSYVHSAHFQMRPPRVTHDFSRFRATCSYRHGELLTHWMARHFRIEAKQIDLSPWLTADAAAETHGKVVMARSLRYHTPKFPWRQLVNTHRAKAVFVGLPDEHLAFTREFGDVFYRPVENALEMACLIAGSDLFIGNQSCPCWIAMGLGHSLVQESHLPCPNSRIPRPNAQYIFE